MIVFLLGVGIDNLNIHGIIKAMIASNMPEKFKILIKAFGNTSAIIPGSVTVFIPDMVLRKNVCFV